MSGFPDGVLTRLGSWRHMSLPELVHRLVNPRGSIMYLETYMVKEKVFYKHNIYVS